jgi:hypothetical protein
MNQETIGGSAGVAIKLLDPAVVTETGNGMVQDPYKRNAEPYIDKMFDKSAKIGKIDAFETKNGCVVLYHTPTYQSDKKIYWDAIYQNALSKYIDVYNGHDIYVAWYLRRSENEHIHTAIIVPIAEFLSWCEDIPTDRARGQNKWSLIISEDLFDNSYMIKFSGKDAIDMAEYANPFELFLDKTDLEELMPKSEVKTGLIEENTETQGEQKIEGYTCLKIENMILLVNQEMTKEKELGKKVCVVQKSNVTKQAMIDRKEEELESLRHDLNVDMAITKELLHQQESCRNEILKLKKEVHEAVDQLMTGELVLKTEINC